MKEFTPDQTLSMARDYFELQDDLAKMHNELTHHIVENDMRHLFSINWSKLRKITEMS